MKPEETFLSRDYLRAEVKHKALTPQHLGSVVGRIGLSEALFVCMEFCPEPLTAARLLEVPSEKVHEPCWLW